MENYQDVNDEVDLTGAILLLDDADGMFIPQRFAEKYGEFIHNKEDKYELLQGPDEGDDYWNIWNGVLANTVITLGGFDYTLHQDGDLWAIPTIRP